MPWEGVALLPFIDEARLLDCIQHIDSSKLTWEERSRNETSCARIIRYQTQRKHHAHSSTLKHYPPILSCLCGARPYTLPSQRGDSQHPHFRLLPETECGKKAPPHFPSIYWLSPSCRLAKAGVSLFGNRDSRASLCLDLVSGHQEELGLSELGSRMLSRTVCVEFPYLKQAIVEFISTETHQITKKDPSPKPLTKEQQRTFALETRKALDHLEHKAIFVHNPFVFVFVRTLQSQKENSDGVISNVWNSALQAFPLEVFISLLTKSLSLLSLTDLHSYRQSFPRHLRGIVP